MIFNHVFSRTSGITTILVITSAVWVGAATPALLDLQKMMSSQEMPSLNGLDLNSLPEKTQVPTSRSFIDNSIDQDSYFVGMGDVFSISILEIPSVNYTAQINQNGDVYISQLGLLKLGKVSLREAKEEIAGFVKKKLKSNQTIYVSLKEGKKACVSVNGSVTSPGTAIYEGIMRISDCMLKANKMVLFLPSEINLRDVEVERVDTTLHLDILKYVLANDTRQNPYIYPGDRIYVSPISRKVFIQGKILNPLLAGFFPIRDHETLADLLSVIALEESADSNYIIIQQGRNTSSRKMIITSVAEAATTILDDMDMITFPPKKDYPEIIGVSISGAVARPGAYPSTRQTTNAEEIIALAGGTLEQADLDRIVILRDPKISTIPKEYKAEKMKIDNPVANNQVSARPELNASMTRLLNFKDFIVIPLSKDKPVILRNGDHIFVPLIETFVYVSGCVNKPGAYPFVKGKERNYYIEQAGGFTAKSDRSNTFTLTHIQDAIQMRDGQHVERGDIVVVADSQNNKTLTTVLLPFLQIVSTLTAVILTIISIQGASWN